MHIEQPIYTWYLDLILLTLFQLRLCELFGLPETKGAGKAVPQRTFRRAFSPVDLTFLRASKERGEREIGGVIMMRGHVCERKLLADAKIR